MKRMKKKLRGAQGESIAEVLIAVLISALALALLAGMISGSINLIRKGEKSMQEYIGKENALAARSGAVGVGSVSAPERLTDGSATDIDVNCYRIDVPGGSPVVAYEVRPGA